MEDNRQTNFVTNDDIASLITKTAWDDFGNKVLSVLSKIARIENFGAYYITDLSRPKPTLSFWSGRISDYWFQRDADLILGTKRAQKAIVKQVNSAPEDGVHIERWHPKQDDTRRAIYVRNGIVERIAVSSKEGRSGIRSFYLRNAADGWLSDEEYSGLCQILPTIHGLIGLRNKIVGTERHHIQNEGEASRLRDSNVPAFSDLSPREAAVCDLILDGQSVAATALALSVSETTIRTLRARAYKKLNVSSATELMALFLRSQIRN